MSSVTVCNCSQNTSDPACLRAVSYRLSDQQQKKPNSRTCWVSSMERRLGVCWLNADADGKQCPKLVCSGRSDTEELGCAGIGIWTHRVYTALVLERQAYLALYASVSTDPGRISGCHWSSTQNDASTKWMDWMVTCCRCVWRCDLVSEKGREISVRRLNIDDPQTNNRPISGPVHTFWKISNDHNSAMRHPIESYFGLAWVFRDGGSNVAISGCINSKIVAGSHFEKISNGHISETHYPIQFMYVPRPHFAPGLYNDCWRIWQETGHISQGKCRPKV